MSHKMYCKFCKNFDPHLICDKCKVTIIGRKGNTGPKGITGPRGIQGTYGQRGPPGAL